MTPRQTQKLFSRYLCRFLSGALALTLAQGPLPAHASCEHSRRTLRPQTDQAGLEGVFAGLEEGDAESGRRGAPTEILSDMAAAVDDALAGRMLPNTTGATYLNSQKTSLMVWTDFSGSGPLSVNPLVLSGNPQSLLLLPHSADWADRPAFSGLTRYQARVDVHQVFARLQERHPEILTLYEESRPSTLRATLRLSTRTKRRWAERVLQQIRTVLGNGEGEPQPAVDWERSPEVRQVLEGVRELNRSRSRLDRALSRAVDRILEASDDAGQTAPAGVISEALLSLRPGLEPWPRVQAAVEQFERLLPADGREPVEEAVGFIWEDIPDLTRFHDLFALERRLSSGVSIPTRLRYEAYRSVWRQELKRVEKLLVRMNESGSEPPERFLRSLQRWGQWVTILETEAAYTDAVLEAGRPDSIGQRARVRPGVIGGAGLLFLKSDGTVRAFVPSGGLTQPLELASRYFPARVAPFFKPGDRVALIVPSLTGFPNLEQVEYYQEDAFLLARFLPGNPEVLLGTVTEGDAFRLWGPPARSDPEAHWVESANRLSDALIPYRAFQQRVLGGLYTPPESVQQDTPDIKRLAKGIGKARGRRPPSGKTVRRATRHLGPMARWLLGTAEKLTDLLQAAIQESYTAEKARAMIEVVQVHLRERLERLKRMTDPEELNSELPRAIGMAQMFVAEQLAAETLTGENPPLVLVQIEGLTEPELPDIAADTERLLAERREQTRDREEKAGQEQEAQLERFLSNLRLKIGKDNKTFPDPEEALAFAERWARQRLEADQPVGSSEFRAVWKKRQKEIGALSERVARMKARADEVLAEGDPAALQTLTSDLDAFREEVALLSSSRADELKGLQSRLEAAARVRAQVQEMSELAELLDGQDPIGESDLRWVETNLTQTARTLDALDSKKDAGRIQALREARIRLAGVLADRLAASVSAAAADQPRTPEPPPILDRAGEILAGFPEASGRLEALRAGWGSSSEQKEAARILEEAAGQPYADPKGSNRQLIRFLRKIKEEGSAPRKEAKKIQGVASKQVNRGKTEPERRFYLDVSRLAEQAARQSGLEEALVWSDFVGSDARRRAAAEALVRRGPNGLSDDVGYPQTGYPETAAAGLEENFQERALEYQRSLAQVLNGDEQGPFQVWLFSATGKVRGLKGQGGREIGPPSAWRHLRLLHYDLETKRLVVLKEDVGAIVEYGGANGDQVMHILQPGAEFRLMSDQRNALLRPLVEAGGARSVTFSMGEGDFGPGVMPGNAVFDLADGSGRILVHVLPSGWIVDEIRPEAEAGLEEGILGRPGRMVEVALPDVIPLYFQGADLFFAGLEGLVPRAPEGIRFDARLLPVQAWEDLGLIFQRTGFETPPNPRRLPVMALTPEAVRQLKPVDVIARVFAARLGLPESAAVGAVLYEAEDGRLHLRLFV